MCSKSQSRAAGGVQHKPDPVQQKPDGVHQKPGLVQHKPGLFSILRTLQVLKNPSPLLAEESRLGLSFARRGKWDREYALGKRCVRSNGPRFAIPTRGGDLEREELPYGVPGLHGAAPLGDRSRLGGGVPAVGTPAHISGSSPPDRNRQHRAVTGQRHARRHTGFRPQHTTSVGKELRPVAGDGQPGCPAPSTKRSDQLCTRDGWTPAAGTQLWDEQRQGASNRGGLDGVLPVGLRDGWCDECSLAQGMAGEAYACGHVGGLV